MLGQHTLKPSDGSRKRKKRIGRGDGSGKGTYCGKGVKGQKSRTGKKLKAWFEGGQTPMVQRMPKLRGFTNPNHVEFQVVNIEKIAKHFKAGEKVDIVALAEKNLISNLKNPVKILGSGEIDHAVEVMVDAVTKSAKEKIEKAGGKCMVLMTEESAE